jgi:hypothetical protein
MDLPFQLLDWLVNDEPPFLEAMMEFPPCPVCGVGRLLPFSEAMVPFSFWVCTTLSCGYTIGRNLTEQTYYKGTAAAQPKEKASKSWTQYDF